MIQTGTLNVRSRTNATWRTPLLVTDEDGTPIDLTGGAAKLQLAAAAGGAALVTAATGGQGITLGGAAGTIEIVLPQATMAVLAPGVYVWDLLVTDALGERHVWVAGTWTHERGVTTP